MSELLSSGTVLKSADGVSIRVDKFLAKGGQGEVYIADYNGKKMALKWYKKAALGKNPQAFYENIKKNVLRGAPSKEFLWPVAITEWQDETFGYVMDLRPEGYYEISEYMLTHVRFKSYKTIIDAALHIVTAFRILHNSGYAYQDLNDGNFFINPVNGDVLICDNDNVAPEKTETGIIGKPRYMAPEIVMSKNKPDSYSDRFSMSVILYILFCLNHPLEGKRYLATALTTDLQERLYGSEALFMMDPNDSSNGPHPVIHRNSLAVWPCLPEYMRDIFTTAFGQKALQRPAARPKEKDWLSVLTRFRSEIVSCSCGNEVFTQNGDPCKCDSCGKLIRAPFKLVFRDYAIPALKGSRIYRCQLGVCDEAEALSPIAAVLEKKETGALGIKNRSGKHWDAITSKGVARKVAPEEIIPLKDGISFTVSGTNNSITIKSI